MIDLIYDFNFVCNRIFGDLVRTLSRMKFSLAIFMSVILLVGFQLCAQSPAREKVDLGSQTAKNGFRNEAEIAAKFNNWQTDDDAKRGLISWVTSWPKSRM